MNRLLKAFLWAVFLLEYTQANSNGLLEKADKFLALPFDHSFVVEANDTNGAEVNISRYKVKTRKRQFSLVETVFPERQVGRKLLMRNSDLWFYTPDIKRPTRVSMQQKLTGEVSNGDIVRTSFAGDYEIVKQTVEKLGGQDAVKLELKKKKDEATYSFVALWLKKENNQPIKALFKTEGNTPLKTAHYLEPKKIMSATIVSKIEIVSEVSKNQSSRLKFYDYKKEELDDAVFSKESLSN